MPAATQSEQPGDATQGEQTSGGDGATYSPRVRRTGGVLLILTGALGAVLGIALFGYALIGGFAGVPPLTIALFALPTVIVGAIQLYGGWMAWRGRRWRVAMGSGIVGLLFGPNPILIPVKVVGIVFLGLSEDQFP